MGEEETATLVRGEGNPALPRQRWVRFILSHLLFADSNGNEKAFMIIKIVFIIFLNPEKHIRRKMGQSISAKINKDDKISQAIIGRWLLGSGDRGGGRKRRFIVTMGDGPLQELLPPMSPVQGVVRSSHVGWHFCGAISMGTVDQCHPIGLELFRYYFLLHFFVLLLLFDMFPLKH